jgi:hypothetical protein
MVSRDAGAAAGAVVTSLAAAAPGAGRWRSVSRSVAYTSGLRPARAAAARTAGCRALRAGGWLLCSRTAVVMIGLRSRDGIGAHHAGTTVSRRQPRSVGRLDGQYASGAKRPDDQWVAGPRVARGRLALSRARPGRTPAGAAVRRRGSVARPRRSPAPAPAPGRWLDVEPPRRRSRRTQCDGSAQRDRGGSLRCYGLSQRHHPGVEVLSWDLGVPAEVFADASFGEADGSSSFAPRRPPAGPCRHPGLGRA